jgi:hypothetical protein
VVLARGTVRAKNARGGENRQRCRRINLPGQAPAEAISPFRGHFPMRRTGWIVGLLALASALGWVAPPDRAGAQPKEGEKAAPKAEPSPEQFLWKRGAWAGLERDNEPTLKEALDNLANHATSPWRGVTFDIDDRAFKQEGLSGATAVADTRIVADAPIPGGNEALVTVLKKVLARVLVPSGATYLVRRDAIEITTNKAAREEVWGKDHPEPFLPLVQANFSARPLADALQELADQSDRSVVLDGRVAAKGKTQVTARLRNMPLDTAVELLARGADLHAVLVEGGLFVTTKAEAEALAKRRQAKRKPARACCALEKEVTRPPAHPEGPRPGR